MPWQLRGRELRDAILALVKTLDGSCALVGTVGVQVHLAAKLGLEIQGPPAHAIEIVVFEGRQPGRDLRVPVKVVDALGFDASLKAGARRIILDGDEFPVAAPEHILGLRLASPDLPTDAKLACFVLMRLYEGQLDLEEARGFLKRSDVEGRQALLAELAYLAA